MDQSTRAQISALAKDEGLIAVVLKLCDKWGDSAFDIVDHWEASLHGVGLGKKDDHSVLVYIDNFGKADGVYGVELENPPSGSEFPYTVAGKYDSVSFDDLSSLVGRHLGIAPSGGPVTGDSRV
jgi:hypothetical protein